MRRHRPVVTARPRRHPSRLEVEPLLVEGLIGWVAHHEDVPLLRHDITSWEQIADHSRVAASYYRALVAPADDLEQHVSAVLVDRQVSAGAFIGLSVRMHRNKNRRLPLRK
jgi:hypothetical protein